MGTRLRYSTRRPHFLRDLPGSLNFKRRVTATVVALALLVWLVVPARLYAQAAVAVIVNSKNPVSNLSLDALRRLYLGQNSTFANRLGNLVPYVRFDDINLSETDRFHAASDYRQALVVGF